MAAALAGAAYLRMQPALGRSAAGPEHSPTDAAAGEPKDRKDPAEGGADRAASVPIATAVPVQRTYRRKVIGYGTLGLDPRTARVVSMATVGVVRAVAALPGQHVKPGEVLFTVAPDPLAFLAYRQAVSARGLAQAELGRLRAQRADNLATASQVETAEKALSDAEAGVDAARRQGAAAGSEDLRAPVDAVVTSINVNVGDRPAVGAALATLAPTVLGGITVGIEPDEARLVRAGDPVQLRPAVAGAGERTGHVAVVGRALDKGTRLVPVTVALDPAGPPDAPAGSTVEAEIATREVAAYSVPRSAVVHDAEGTAVFEVVDGKAHRVPVVVEVDDGGHVGVSGALDGRRRIATTGAYELEDGASVAEPNP
ncbi:MAG: efflux RND transporter periplasmic adaptor subunit [Proteobacteria bacterium]|nr:efflux RND transporter periplasmic adaptor subunit [Pseudomonadota bacterium]